MTATPYLTAADLRDLPLLDDEKRFTDDLLESLVTEFEDVAERYRGVAFTPRQGVHTGHADTRGVLDLPQREVRAVYVVDADASRRVSDAVTATSTTLTSATAVFTTDDIGKLVLGAGITAGTTIASRNSATSVVLSAATAATATGVVVTIGTALTVDTLDEAPGRAHLCTRGRMTAGYRYGLTAPPAALLRACREYVRATALEHTGNQPRNTISYQGQDGFTYRESTPDWSAGRPTGYISVDRVLNSLRDYRMTVG